MTDLADKIAKEIDIASCEAFERGESGGALSAAKMAAIIRQHVAPLVEEASRLTDELKAACEQRDSNARALLHAMEEIVWQEQP